MSWGDHAQQQLFSAACTSPAIDKIVSSLVKRTCSLAKFGRRSASLATTSPFSSLERGQSVTLAVIWSAVDAREMGAPAYAERGRCALFRPAGRCGDSRPLGQPENDSAVRLFRNLSVRTVERLLRPIWVRGARHGRGARCHRSALPWRSKWTPIRWWRNLRERRASHRDYYRCDAENPNHDRLHAKGTRE